MIYSAALSFTSHLLNVFDPNMCFRYWLNYVVFWKIVGNHIWYRTVNTESVNLSKTFLHLTSCSRRGIRKCYLLSVTDAFSPPNNKNPWIVLHSINVRKRFFPNFQVRELNIYQLNKFSQSASNLSAKQASQPTI